MPISNVMSTPPGSQPSGPTGSSNLGTQQFLQLLVSQMKSQDPLQPMDNTQFVTQLAQFSSLETLQKIQASLDSSLGAQLLGQSMGLLGRTVVAQPPGGPAVTGTVKSIKLVGSDVTLDLGTTSIHLSDVQQINAT